jgi:hypothetical protein
MATIEEYKIREEEFMARTDALCEDIVPSKCDCNACPCKELCQWLCDNLPDELKVKF